MTSSAGRQVFSILLSWIRQVVVLTFLLPLFSPQKRQGIVREASLTCIFHMIQRKRCARHGQLQETERRAEVVGCSCVLDIRAPGCVTGQDSPWLGRSSLPGQAGCSPGTPCARGARCLRKPARVKMHAAAAVTLKSGGYGLAPSARLPGGVLWLGCSLGGGRAGFWWLCMDCLRKAATCVA